MAPRVQVGALSWLAAGLCLLIASWLVRSIISSGSPHDLLKTAL